MRTAPPSPFVVLPKTLQRSKVTLPPTEYTAPPPWAALLPELVLLTNTHEWPGESDTAPPPTKLPPAALFESLPFLNVSVAGPCNEMAPPRTLVALSETVTPSMMTFSSLIWTEPPRSLTLFPLVRPLINVMLLIVTLSVP